MVLAILEANDPDILIWSVRAFYILAAYAIIIVRFVPDLRDRFLDYGARSSATTSPSKPKETFLPKWFRIQFDPVLDWLAEKTVPHSWFFHFYLCSTIGSSIWIWMHLQTLPSLSVDFSLQAITSWKHRAFLGLLLMQVQGLRRLYECLAFAKPSRSTMWLGHYVIGIAFYLVTDVAIWLETAVNHGQASMVHPPPTGEILFNGMRTVLCLFIFFYNSYRQYQVHKYLASLNRYQVPDHHIFVQTNLVCPHYSFEVNIYLTLAVLTARDLRVFNSTMLCAALFVTVNLGVTADGTKKWLMEKFPKQRSEIAQKRRMLGSVW